MSETPGDVRTRAGDGHRGGTARRGGLDESSGAPEGAPPPFVRDIGIDTGIGAEIGPSAPEGRPPSGSAGGRSIVTRGLTKRFRGGQVAVDGLDLAVPTGAVFGFLGPNGSGKPVTGLWRKSEDRPWRSLPT